MSAEWPVVTLGEIVSFKTGKLDSNAASESGVYPFFTCSPTTLAIDEYAFDTEAVLLAGNNANGIFAVKYYKGKFNAYQRTYVITPLSGVEVDLKWLYFRIKHVTSELQQMSVGSATKFLTKKILDAFKIVLPPMSVQRKQSKILWDIQDKIDCNSQINQTLEQMAQTIFKSWFVDFEPVKAKIAALDAGGSDEDALNAAMQAISGKDADQLATMQAEQPEQYAELRATAELFPSAMQESELGEIPDGWEVSEIGNEVTVVGGGTPSTKNEDFWEGGGIPWTTPKDLSSLTDKVLIDTDRKITEAGLAKISSGLLPVDTVLMSSRAPVGYLALAKVPVAVNQGYIAMKCERILTPEYVIQWCHSRMDEIKGRASGTTFAEISKKNFKVIPTIVPSKQVLEKYSSHVRSMYCEIELLVRQSQSLSELRDSLLPKLLSGELSVGTEEPSSGKVEQDEANDLNALIEQIESDLPPKSYFMVRERPPREFENIRAIGFMTKVSGAMGEGGGEYLKLPTFLRKLRQNPILEKAFATAIDGVTGIPLFMDGVTAILNKYLGKKIKFDQKTAIVLLAFPKEVVRKTSELLNQSYELSKSAGIDPIDEDQLQRSLSWLQRHRLIYPLNDKHQEWRLVDKFRHEINNWD